jgi:hypothetical protein
MVNHISMMEDRYVNNSFIIDLLEQGAQNDD